MEVTKSWKNSVKRWGLSYRVRVLSFAEMRDLCPAFELLKVF